MIDFSVTSAELHVAEDCLIEEGHVTLFFLLKVSTGYEPPELSDVDLREVSWFAQITAQEDDVSKAGSSVGTLQFRTSNVGRSCWFKLALARGRFEALRSALVHGLKVTEFTVTTPSLEKGDTWEALSNGEHSVESIEVAVSLFSSAHHTADA